MNIIGQLDKNNKPITEGSIIDIHQTVNGENLFVVFSDTDVRYYNSNRPYEYDIYELLDLSVKHLIGTYDKTIEIVGNHKDILDNKINTIIDDRDN